MANSMIIRDFSDELSDDFYALFNGMGNIIGKDTKKLRETKTKLELKKKEFNGLSNIEEENLINANSQLGLDKNGNKKNKTCWKYVKNGFCKHVSKTYSNSLKEDGCNISNLWHPGNGEKEYLKKKIK